MSVEIRGERREPLAAPFPWFGGKSRAASLVWERFGDVPNYCEPFAGSLAILLARPHLPKTETVNDLDGFVSNFWRGLADDPEKVAHYADWPVNEADLHARHLWLVGQRGSMTDRLMGDPEWYDAKIAGWWLYGICAWIGSGWCSGRGPWIVQDGRLVDSRQLGAGREPETADLGSSGQGVNRQLPHLGNSGQGVNRKRPHLGDAGKAPSLALGVNRQIPHVGNPGRGVNRPDENLLPWFAALSDRLRAVRVCCGDWSRILGPSPTFKIGLTGVLLDPPYSDKERASNLYRVDDGSVAVKVRDWAIANGDNPLLRIALCGYDTEHAMPATWTMVHWVAYGGYSLQNRDRDNENRQREVIWFNRSCLVPDEELPLFAAMNLNGEGLA